MKKLTKISSYLTHTIPWLVIIVGPITKVLLHPESTSNHRLFALSVMAIHIVGFYINQSFLVPKLLFNKKLWQFGVALVSLIVLVFFFTTGFQNYLFGSVNPKDLDHGVLLPPHFATAGLILLLALGVATQVSLKWIEQEQKHEKIKDEQVQTELAFLKNQISPHFFFNTLNNIYALIESKPQTAQDITHKLSKLMRYLLYESDKPLVTLGREISFIKTYIDLMRVRLPETVSINFDHGSEMDITEVPPLLFISFIENAFKHGISFQEPCSITIALKRNQDVIEFSIINIIPKNREVFESPGGLGLQNVKRRLSILYKENDYQLDIRPNENIYEVELKIRIND